jgi:type I restriction enzyme S subunit
VRHSDGSINEYSTTYSDFGLSQSRLWPAGTLCITIAANIADTGILNFDACFPDSVVGFLNDIEPTLVRFIELFIRTAKQELERYAPATAQKNINLEVLSGLAVPLPPSAEQVRIVNETDRQMSVIRTLEREESQNSLRVTRLRQSILKWAFEGRLVDQDPNDEPASELLARIQAARTLQPRARALRKSRAAPR